MSRSPHKALKVGLIPTISTRVCAFHDGVPVRAQQVSQSPVEEMSGTVYCGQVVWRPFLSHKQESHVRFMGPHPNSSVGRGRW